MPTSRPNETVDPAHSADPALPDLAGRGKGMPFREPSAGRSRPGNAQTPQDASDEASLALPHERDQSHDMTSETPDPLIEQARLDLENGLQDTGKQPAMDKAYKKLMAD